jgi:hypothetical protein
LPEPETKVAATSDREIRPGRYLRGGELRQGKVQSRQRFKVGGQRKIDLNQVRAGGRVLNREYMDIEKKNKG